MPLISVIVPTYNSQRFIANTLLSVLNQTFTDFELIVVDDGSIDDTLEIVERFTDPRICISSGYANKGIAANRNRGLLRACGAYVAFLDHDDLWTPEKLEYQLDALENNPEYGVSYSWIKLIDEADNFIRVHSRPRHTENVHRNLLAKSFLVTASNPLIRRNCLAETGEFDESIYGADEWDLYLRLAARYKFALCPHFHIRHRLTEGSASSDFHKLEDGMLKAMNKAFSQINPPDKHLESLALGNSYIYLGYKALDNVNSRKNALIALRFAKKSFSNNPALWKNQPTVIKFFYKTLIIALLPPRLANYHLQWATKTFRQLASYH